MAPAILRSSFFGQRVKVLVVLGLELAFFSAETEGPRCSHGGANGAVVRVDRPRLVDVDARERPDWARLRPAACSSFSRKGAMVSA